MTQNKQNRGASTTINDSTRKSRLGHWVRVAVMFLSCGFIFPHAMTEEDMDSARDDADKDVEVKKH